MVPFLASDEAAVDEKLPGGKDLVPPARHRAATGDQLYVSTVIPDLTRRTSSGSPRALGGSMSWRTPIISLWTAGSRAARPRSPPLNWSELSRSVGGSPRVRGCAKSGTADCDHASAIKGWIPARKACPNPARGSFAPVRFASRSLKDAGFACGDGHALASDGIETANRVTDREQSAREVPEQFVMLALAKISLRSGQVLPRCAATVGDVALMTATTS